MTPRVAAGALLDMIIFTKHANDKFSLLRKHKFLVTKQQVLKTLKYPETIDYSRTPLLIAQKQIDREHVLRVVYKKEGNVVKVITFYPGRRENYEKE
jgi:hypothetical protein